MTALKITQFGGQVTAPLRGVCALIGTPNKSIVIGLNRPNSAKPARPAR